jgi:hypothetical protein
MLQKTQVQAVVHDWQRKRLNLASGCTLFAHV